MLKGIHYRNPLFYRTQTLIKLGPSYRRRFEIAASHIPAGASVLDICAGPGDLRHFLPPDCRYTALEASPEFTGLLSLDRIPCVVHDLNRPLPDHVRAFDVAVMLISLCHFSPDRVRSLLDELKQAARKVIIVEEVCEQKRPEGSPLQWVMNYLSAREYAFSYAIMTGEEFRDLIEAAGYESARVSRRYVVGIYDPQAE